MKIDHILQELIIFARERECDDERLLRAAERHLDAVLRIRARRARCYNRKRDVCERCEGPSTSGILCWHCVAVAPIAIRQAFRDARGIEGMRTAAEQVRAWIRTTERSRSEVRGQRSERMAA